MRMLDLFSGIGGFSLAAQWVWGEELEIVYMVENDKHCQRVLTKQWPDVPIYSDIRTFECSAINAIDLITGGFPCQDISIAGKGVGIEGERSGLWTEFKRIIREVRPRFALIENVPALTHRGLDRVLCDLAEIGYDAEWQCISASEVGAWHKRERIWIVAYPNRREGRSGIKPKSIQSTQFQFSSDDRISTKIPDSDQKRLQSTTPEWIRSIREAEREFKGREYSRTITKKWNNWSVEPDVGRVAHGIPDRVDRLKSLGNTIVPQVAYIIMQQIKRLIESL